MKEVKVAMIGYGGIARSHKKGYEIIEAEALPIKLVAICDIDGEKFKSASKTNLGATKIQSLEGINTYTDVDEMLAAEEIDMVDICLPSFLHKDMTVKLLRAGKDVLCEKPMALNTPDCLEMLRVSEETGRRLMIGLTLRFEEIYLYLKECIDGGRFGRLKNLFMDRLGDHPLWGFERWYTSTERSGGCILDLHVHDVDMARFLFGEPKAVSTVSYDGLTRWQVVNSRLFYDDLTVIATASWDEAASCKFHASYRARFETASVIYDGKRITVYPDEGEPYEPEIRKADRMAEQIKYVAALSADHSMENKISPPESACKTVTLVELLRESAERDGERLEVK